jgi:hypothetical protein
MQEWSTTMEAAKREVDGLSTVQSMDLADPTVRRYRYLNEMYRRHGFAVLGECAHADDRLLSAFNTSVREVEQPRVRDARIEVDDLQSEVVRLRERAQHQEADLARTRTRAGDVEEEASQLLTRLQDAEKRLEEGDRENHRLRGEVSSLETRLAASQAPLPSSAGSSATSLGPTGVTIADLTVALQDSYLFTEQVLRTVRPVIPPCERLPVLETLTDLTRTRNFPRTLRTAIHDLDVEDPPADS